MANKPPPPSTVDLPRLSPLMPLNRLRVVVSAGADAGAHIVSTGDAVTVGTATGNDLQLTDNTVSRYHLELVAGTDGVLVADLGSTNGTWLGNARVERARLPVPSELRLGRSAIRIEGAAPGVAPLHVEDSFGELRGGTPLMRRLMASLGRLAQNEASVLLTGESGTGKELIARALHERGARTAQPFVTVDCAALAPNLVASELFGHEKGAFTGAERRTEGAFERAHGGVVFLDEVGELPTDLQGHLLGVLERRRVRRVGGASEIPVDVRVISATHRDLRAEVNSGRFRLDLYYRLAVVCVEVPPLRRRGDDIPMLVEHFLRECGYDGPVERVFPPELIARLAEHDWPGNVRELRNLVEATLATGELPLGAKDPIEATDVARPPPGTAGTPRTLEAVIDVRVELDRPYKEARAELIEQFEGRYVSRLMQRAEDNVSGAARLAAMTRSHLFELLRRHGLK